MAEIKCPCGLRNHMEEEDCKETNCNACCPLTKPQTNADRVRAMNAEQLAEWALFRAPQIGREYSHSLIGLITWLQQPAEGE